MSRKLIKAALAITTNSSAEPTNMNYLHIFRAGAKAHFERTAQAFADKPSADNWKNLMLAMACHQWLQGSSDADTFMERTQGMASWAMIEEHVRKEYKGAL